MGQPQGLFGALWGTSGGREGSLESSGKSWGGFGGGVKGSRGGRGCLGRSRGVPGGSGGRGGEVGRGPGESGPVWGEESVLGWLGCILGGHRKNSVAVPWRCLGGSRAVVGARGARVTSLSPSVCILDSVQCCLALLVNPSRM